MAFQGFLKQSTSVDILLGPFLDEDDGKTAEAGTLTIEDEHVLLSKNGQGLSAKNDANDAVHDAGGYHNCPLNATDTNTVGQLTITCHPSGALPVRLDYHIVEEAVYDAMYGGSAAGPLQSTTAARKLDVTAGGAAGIDWANVEGQGTAVDLSATNIQLCDTITTYTGNTLQTGNSYPLVEYLKVQDTNKSFLDNTVRGHWMLSQPAVATADNFQDESSYAHHGTLVGSATSEQGRLHFDGSTGYVSVTSSDNLEFSCTATKGIEIWADGGVYQSSGTIVQSEDTPTTYWVAIRDNTNDEHEFDVNTTIVVKKSTDSGASWAAEVEIDDQGGSYDMRAPQLFLYDNGGTETLVCFWTRTDVGGNHRTYYAISTDAGANWTAAAILLVDAHRATKGRPRLMTDGKIGIALYSEVTEGSNETYFYVADSLDLTTAGWDAYLLTDDNGDETSFIEVKSNGSFSGRLLALTRDNSGQYWRTFSTDYGETWAASAIATDLPVSNGTPVELVRTIRPDDGTILAFFTHTRQIGLEGAHTLGVYQSFDEGENFYFLTNIHYGMSLSAYPSVLALSDGTYAITWCSNGGSSDQYFDNLNANCQITETPCFTVAVTLQRDTTNTMDAVIAYEGATQYRIRFETDGALKIEWGGNTTFQTGVFAHDTLAHDLVFTASNYHLKVYKDGDLLDVVDTPGDLSASTNDLFIGAQHASPASNFFDGLLSDLVIQATVWTPEQIRERFERKFQANRWEEQFNRMGAFTQAESAHAKVSKIYDVGEGVPGLIVTVDTVVDAILVDTGTTLPASISTHDGKLDGLISTVGAAGVGLTDLGGMSDGMKAEVESEANDALVALKLDHLVAVADADDAVNNSIVAKLAASDGDWSNFVSSTDALQTIRDRGDAAWVTAPNDPTAAAIADAVWDELLTGNTHNNSTSAGRRLRQANLGQAIAHEGAAQAGGNDTITLADGAEDTVDDLYHEALCFIAAGTGAGQVRFILSYDASTRIATVHTDWEVNPENGSEYVVYGNAASNLHAIQDDVQSATDLKDFVDAGYDPDTNKVQGVVLVDTLTTYTGNTLQTADVANLNDISAADVNAQVLDVLNVDTFAEPGQGLPAATTTIVDKIGYLYKNWRNKKDQDATTWQLYADDASTVDQKATVSDDGTDAIKGEIATGP